MIDPQLLRGDLAAVAQKLKLKGYELPLSDYQELEAQRKPVSYTHLTLPTTPYV